MPIVYEEEFDPLKGKTDTEKRRIKERIKYYKGRRQLSYNQRNAQKVRTYLKEYYAANKEKWSQKYQEKTRSPGTLSESKVDEITRNEIIEQSLLKSRSNPLRARVGRTEVKKIMQEIIENRCKQYNDDSNMKKKILCIIGGSGVGKTLASLHLQNKFGANAICSFTTRPARETEVEGREHHFVDIDPPKDDVLAMVRFGNYKYYALKSQVFGDCTVYVIDESGYRNLIKRCGDEFNIYTLNIVRKRKLRVENGISYERMERDRGRIKLDSYDYVVENNSSKSAFFQEIERVYNEVKNK